MKKPLTILLGVATLWPLAYFVIFLLKAMSIMFQVMDGKQVDPALMKPMIVLAVVTTIVSIALMVIYILHANRNRSVPESSRLLWTMLFIFVGAIAMPVYYVLHVHPWASDATVPETGE